MKNKDSLCRRDGLDITPKKILNCMTVPVVADMLSATE